jgi:hypothetical protein
MDKIVYVSKETVSRTREDGKMFKLQFLVDQLSRTSPTWTEY